MPLQTILPTRPSKNAPVAQQIWTVWEMLQYFINSVYDTAANRFATGYTTVPSGTSSVVVTHSLGRATYSVMITPLEDLGDSGAHVPWWIDTKTSTQFTLHLPANAGSDLSFDWMVIAV